MRPVLVVVNPPGFDEELSIGQIGEPVGVEAFVPKAAIEALDEGVLDWLTGIDELQLDVVLVGPLVEDLTGQLRAVVEHDGLGCGAIVR